MKIPRVIEKYGLDGLGEELERRWIGEAGESMSLRDLSTYVNRRIVGSVAADIDRPTMNWNAEMMFRALVGDDVTSGTRVEVEAILDRAGIDVEEIRSDFVSHQAVYSYLTKERGVRPSSGRDPSEIVDNRRRDIQKLQGRLATVSERALDTLNRTSRLDLGTFEVMVNVQVFCEGCDSQLEITEVFDNGGCMCDV